MDHGERDRVRPVVHLAIEDVLVVDDDGEAEEDPNRDVGVGEDDFLEHAIGDRHFCSATRTEQGTKP